jgi:cytoskeletal protein CcmA (bactofilin family)
MWKMGDNHQPERPPRPGEQPPRPVAGKSPSASKQGGPATIGPSITIKGEVSGDEDLVIQGRIEGSVTLKKNHVTVGADGRVKADVFGKSVVVEGEVEGDLRGADHVVLRRSARVQGNISAPRVTLEDGASFRGGIDMQDPSSPGPASPDTTPVKKDGSTEPRAERNSKAN